MILIDGQFFKTMYRSNKTKLVIFFMLSIGLSLQLSFAQYPHYAEERNKECCEILNRLNNITHFSKDTTTEEFIKWWETAEYWRPHGIMKVDYRLDHLRPAKTEKGFKTYILPGDKNISIIIQIPISEKTCNLTKFNSILKASDNDPGLIIDLNPFCYQQSHGPDEVDITLYWLSVKEKPIVSITTNHPAYVPSMLYIYNKTKKSYELAAKRFDA